MEASRTLLTNLNTKLLGFHSSSSSSSSSLTLTTLNQPYSRVYCTISNPNNRRTARVTAAKGKGKDNVWSIDNDAANGNRGRSNGGRRRTKMRNSSTKKLRVSESDDGVMVSGSMLIESEKVLQTQV